MPRPPVPGAHGETTCQRTTGQNVLSFTTRKRSMGNRLAATKRCLIVRKINSQAGLGPPPQASPPLLLQSIGRQDGRKDSLFSGSEILSLSPFLPSSLGTPTLLPLWPLCKAIRNTSAGLPSSGILGRKRWNTRESQGSDNGFGHESLKLSKTISCPMFPWSETFQQPLRGETGRYRAGMGNPGSHCGPNLVVSSPQFTQTKIQTEDLTSVGVLLTWALIHV